MKPGPVHVDLGLCMCPNCCGPMTVKTNKHGYPYSACKVCRSQEQPRNPVGSLGLIWRIYEWHNVALKKEMLEPEEMAAMKKRGEPSRPASAPPGKPAPAPSPSPTAPKPSPAPKPSLAPVPAPPAPKKQAWWDKSL